METIKPDAPPAPPTPDPNVIAFKESSNIRGAKLDQATGVVTVTFANEKTYRFGGFTTEIMREWAEAQSAGTWFHQHVRQHPERHPPIGDDGKPIAAPAPATPPAAKKTAAAEPPKPPVVKPAVARGPEPTPTPEPPIDHDAGKKRTAAKIAHHRAILAGERKRKSAST